MEKEITLTPHPASSKARRSRQKRVASSPAAIPADPWEGWQPSRQDKVRSPHALQERHSPSAAVSVRVGGGRQMEQGQRRIVDARLWDAMAPAQQDAALEIAHVFETVSRGIGYATSDWTRQPSMRGTVNAAEIHGRLLAGYNSWAERCRKEGVSHSMVIDILVFGFSCQALDRDRRARAGWAKRNLLKGLALYCDVKGWPS
jgi:hypothetical protein